MLQSRLAADLARRAGSLIADALGQARSVSFKSEVDLVTEVDLAAQALIVEGIGDAFPGDRIIAEEDDGRPDEPELQERGCWYVDPIDGTTNFVHGLPHVAVSIGYVEAGRPRAAAVYDPCKDELFLAQDGSGAFLNGRRLGVSTTRTLDRALLVTGFPYDRRQRVDAYLAYFRRFMCAAQDLRRLGCASLDLCYVAAGRFDGFWEWKLQPWDTAAGWLIVQEAGGLVSDFDGAAYHPRLPRILATNGHLHAQALEILAELSRAGS
ncbi:MAG: inositol monophosphatase [Deltaproteobacteria bacterium]|nr:inositol monophosphatase [Deltaproteobacteria bacterium]